MKPISPIRLLCSSASVLAVFAVASTLAQTNSTPPAASATEAMYWAAAERAEQKLNFIQQNAQRAHPDQRPTVFTELEINSYMASGQVKLPVGVRSLHLTGTPGVVSGTAQVDFDAIIAGRRSANPLLSMFSGVHRVEASGHASAGGGQGHVHIDTVLLDGVTVPRVALEFFIDRYLKPKHPELGIDSIFKLPERIDVAIVGQHALTMTQK